MNQITLTSSPFLYASAGTGAMPYIPSNDQNPLQGMIRCINNQFQIFTGTSWETLSQQVSSIGMTSEAEKALSWAKQKQQEEMELAKLCEKNQSVKLAVDNLKAAQSKLDTIVILSKEYE